jgi:hypothetical protein
MQYIQLTRGFITAVDDWNLEELNQYMWYASGPQGRPARRLHTKGRRLIYMYHQILNVMPWDLTERGLEIGHGDDDPLNNQEYNLKIVTHKENMRNKFSYGIRQGICFDNTHSKWKAYFDAPDISRINIGTYITKEQAIEALTNFKLANSYENN